MKKAYDSLNLGFRCGPRKRWRDFLQQDLKFIDVAEADWYEESRVDWRALYHRGIEAHREVTQTACGPSVVKTVTCTVCGRSFRRESDRKRHKCLDERRKPVSEQRGAVQCQNCHRWFRSKGGMVVHRSINKHYAFTFME